MLLATLRFLLLTAILVYAALSLTVALIVILSGGPIWTAIAVGTAFPVVFFWSLVTGN